MPLPASPKGRRKNSLSPPPRRTSPKERGKEEKKLESRNIYIEVQMIILRNNLHSCSFIPPLGELKGASSFHSPFGETEGGIQFPSFGGVRGGLR
jgi:hypothetical protein